MTKELILSLIPGASEEQADKFIKYYELLIEWNEKMNLTAITEEREVAEKHFADSLLPMELIPQNARCIDVGTGAGFPGIPLMIMRPDITVTLLDSLNKRLIFLNEVIRALGLEGRAKTLHMRSEDAGRAARAQGRIRRCAEPRRGQRKGACGMDGAVRKKGRRQHNVQGRGGEGRAGRGAKRHEQALPWRAAYRIPVRMGRKICYCGQKACPYAEGISAQGGHGGQIAAVIVLY